MGTAEEPSSLLANLMNIDCSKVLIFCSGGTSLCKKRKREREGGRKKENWSGNIRGLG